MTVFRSNNPEDQHSPHWIGPELLNTNEENALNFLNQKETEPTPKDTLGFVPLGDTEKNRALKLYEAYQEDSEHGVARYLARVARTRNKQGKAARAAASVFTNEVVAPYKEAVEHQGILENAMQHAPELGSTLFEDKGIDDSARDATADYLEARQKNNGVSKERRVRLPEFMGVATKVEVVDLLEEVYSNAVLRENFWHRIIDSARDSYPLLDKIAEQEEVLRIDPSKDVQKTDYRRGTMQDPAVANKRRMDDSGRK